MPSGHPRCRRHGGGRRAEPRMTHSDESLTEQKRSQNDTLAKCQSLGQLDG